MSTVSPPPSGPYRKHRYIRFVLRRGRPASKECSPMRGSRTEINTADVEDMLRWYPLTNSPPPSHKYTVAPIDGSYICRVVDAQKKSLVHGRVVQFSGGSYLRSIVFEHMGTEDLVSVVKFVPFGVAGEVTEQAAELQEYWLVPTYQLFIVCPVPRPVIVDAERWIRDLSSAQSAWRRRSQYLEPSDTLTAMHRITASAEDKGFATLDAIFDACFALNDHFSQYGTRVWFPTVHHRVKARGSVNYGTACVCWGAGALSRYYFSATDNAKQKHTFVYVWNGMEPLAIPLGMIRQKPLAIEPIFVDVPR